MSDREALTRAICECPEEDMPRLALADWLDEYGTEKDRNRAAFIRAAIAKGDEDSQYEFARFTGWPVGLELAHGEYVGMPGLFRPTLFHHIFEMNSQSGRAAALFRRGFVERISCTGSEWVRQSQLLTARFPIREVVLTSWPELECTESPSLRRYLFHIKNANPFRTVNVDFTELYYHIGKGSMPPGEDSRGISGEDILFKLLKMTWEKIEFTYQPCAGG